MDKDHLKLLSVNSLPFGNMLAVLVAGVSLVGCSWHAPGIAGVQIDAARASESILQEYDKDQSGSLSKDELQAVPAIGDRFAWYDTDHNGQISEKELRGGLLTIFDPKIGLVTATCEVTRNGKALSGAKVEFVPLPALKESIPSAEGTTDDNGAARLTIKPDELPANAPAIAGLMRPGLYLVQVTHPSLKIPDEYNTNTKLSEEVSNHSTAGGPLRIRLRF
jgi:EF hand